MIQLPSTLASSTTLTQRTARRLLLAACAIVGIGVLGSIAANAVTDKPPVTHFVDESTSLAVMASDHGVVGDVELVHDAKAVAGNSKVVWMNVTAYCPCPKCCGKNAQGITASGKPISFDNGHFAAAPSQYTFGTRLVIPGYNASQPVQVLDRGGAIKGNHLDVFFPTHEQAKQWGRRWIAVTVGG